jgi:hypothetical protein
MTGMLASHPTWCDRRLHGFGYDDDHGLELMHMDVEADRGHGRGTVEVALIQKTNLAPTVLLYVSECDGANCGENACIAGDGNMVFLTREQAREVVLSLSQALSLLGDTLPTSILARVA